ncbi:MAG: hypothetical protein AAF487_10070 [Bacteroidota bacterium]
MPIKKRLSIILVLLVFSQGNGQILDSLIHIYGEVAHSDHQHSLDHTFLKIKSDKKEKYLLVCSKNGLFDHWLHSDREYEIVCRKKGFVSKKIIVNTYGIPMEKRIPGFSMQMDFKLFEKVKGQKFPFLREPMGRSSYDREEDNMVWNFDQINKIKEKIRQVREKD